MKQIKYKQIPRQADQPSQSNRNYNEMPMDPEIQLAIIGYIRFSKVGKTKFLGAMIEELGRHGILSTDIMKKNNGASNTVEKR